MENLTVHELNQLIRIKSMIGDLSDQTDSENLSLLLDSLSNIISTVIPKDIIFAEIITSMLKTLK